MLMDIVDKVSIEPAISAFYEKGEPLTIQEIQRIPDSEWETEPQFGHELRVEDQVVWLKVNIHNASKESRWVFDLDFFGPITMTMYQISGGKLAATQRIDSMKSFSARPNPIRQQAFGIELEPDTTSTIYLRYEDSFYN